MWHKPKGRNFKNNCIQAYSESYELLEYTMKMFVNSNIELSRKQGCRTVDVNTK